MTFSVCRRLLQHLERTQFAGVSGPVKFSRADRTGIIHIHQHRSNSSQLVGSYQPTQQSLYIQDIYWSGSQVPSDGRTGNGLVNGKV